MRIGTARPARPGSPRRRILRERQAGIEVVMLGRALLVGERTHEATQEAMELSALRLQQIGRFAAHLRGTHRDGFRILRGVVSSAGDIFDGA